MIFGKPLEKSKIGYARLKHCGREGWKMNPEQIATSNSESAHQKAFFCWLNMAARYGFTIADNMFAYDNPEHLKDPAKLFELNYGVPYRPIVELEYAFAVPNGGQRTGKFGAAATGAKFKAEGVKPGVPDVCVPISLWSKNRSGFACCGLWIEFKKPGEIKDVKPDQKKYHDFLTYQGYVCIVVDNWRKGADAVKNYLSGNVI